MEPHAAAAPALVISNMALRTTAAAVVAGAVGRLVTPFAAVVVAAAPSA